MSPFPGLRERLPGIARALAIAVPAGMLFDWLDTPVPWMIGPMVAIAAVNLMGVTASPPPYARQLGQVVIGSSVSLYFTPPVVAALSTNLGAIALSTVSAFVIGGLGALTLSRISGVDGKSSFFASIPGGAMAMAVLADRHGAEVPPVAIAHSLRVSIVVLTVPFALTYGGIPMAFSPYKPVLPLDFPVLAVWLVAGYVLGAVSERLRLQNGHLLTPIFLGAALTMSGVQLSAVPHWMTSFAQLMFGLVLGARYERAFFVRYKLFLPFAIANSVFVLAASVVVAIFLAWAFDLPIATMILATAPGGMPEMTIVAQALQVGVPVVVAFHLFRIIVVNLGTQYLYGLAVWLRGRLAGAAE